MVVQPGDLLHGDENGLITIPSVEPCELKAAIETIRRREQTVMDFVRGPDFSLTGYRDLVAKESNY
jgi:4-hydroxy-4-methyl-2-oxoglutarate aldolase